LILSKRLTQIEALITSEYTHIWDTCCDHGYLGESLISHQKAPNIHLVDIVPKIITPLNKRLSKLLSNPYSAPSSHASPQTHWQTHCLDISKLPLQKYSGKHLIIIAGIGGDLMIECMRRIMSEHSTREIDFILCPVRHLHTLREQLIELKMTLKEEVLIKEKNIFYEILLLSNTSLIAGQQTPLKPVSPVGDAIWQCKTIQDQSEAQEYLGIKIKHYLNMKRGLDTPEVNKIIQYYQNITISLA
jgi:tRNA (adenine22-N1)-methyltransferase